MALRKSTTVDAARHAPGGVDVTMMIVMHDALRRDLVSLESVARPRAMDDPERRAAVEVGWSVFKNQLHIHHTGEDTTLWPRLRGHLVNRDAPLSVLDAMEEEHNRIDPLITAVDDAFADQASGHERVRDVADALITELSQHLQHEEREALPLIGETLNVGEWQAVIGDMRRTVGLSGAAEFFPWMLHGASEARVAAMIGMLPPPARLLYKRIWNPRYQRRDRW